MKTKLEYVAGHKCNIEKVYVTDMGRDVIW